MLFCSFTFLLLFMPAVLLGHKLLPQKAKRPFLLAASLLFYAWGSPLWLILLLYVLMLDWAGALFMTRGGKQRKAVLAGLIILNVLPLLYYKYTGFFLETVRGLTGWGMAFDDPVLPAGISFFTFQGISYLIDVYRGQAKPQKSIVRFGVYLTLFPQLVAGPIVRYTDLEAQLDSPANVTPAGIRHGLARFTVGLGKKVLLADAMGRLWGTINGDFASAGSIGAVIGILAFSFQIFFDFSGYSDMALGLGEAMGFRLPENFDRPYREDSITGFWRHWHMTLTTWFREYVYFPLGGSRCSVLRRNVNILIVWALTGLWHGAGWNYVLWGLYFAALLMIEKRFMLKKTWYEAIPRLLRRAVTFVLVVIGWGLFSGFGGQLAGTIFAFSPISSKALLTCVSYLPMMLVCAGISFAPAIRLPMPVKRVLTILLFLLCLAALAAEGFAPFVYFQF